MNRIILIILIISLAVFVSAESIITIAAVGDIMMANTYNNNILPEHDGQFLFADAMEVLQNADITIGNLESTLLDSGETVKETNGSTVYAFRTPEKYALNLKNAGFDVMNLANNHIRDFGVMGVNRTKETLDEVNIQYTGFTGEIASMSVNGSNVAIVGFSIYHGMYNMLDLDKSRQVIMELDSLYDIIIVTFHGGMESKDTLHTADKTEYYYNENRGNIVKFSHAVIDAGADLVIGHGPHVPRAMEIYNNRLIAYSLGNFITYTNINTQKIAGYAPVLIANLNSDGSLNKGFIKSFYQKKWHGVRNDTENKAFELIKQLSIEDFPSSHPLFNDDNTLGPG